MRGYNKHTKKAIEYAEDWKRDEHVLTMERWGRPNPISKARPQNILRVLPHLSDTPKTAHEISKQSGVTLMNTSQSLQYLEREGRINIGPDKNEKPTYYVPNQKPEK